MVVLHRLPKPHPERICMNFHKQEIAQLHSLNVNSFTKKRLKLDDKHRIRNFSRPDCTISGHMPVERLHSIEKSPHRAAWFLLTAEMKGVKT
jgi:hypothetical protein